MKLRLTFKGGSGSGNFGHSGRPGEVGGSGESLANVVNTVSELARSNNSGDISLGYFILPNGKLVDAGVSGTGDEYSHVDAIRANPALFGMDDKQSYDRIQALDTAIKNGAIRVRFYGFGKNSMSSKNGTYMSVHTAAANSQTLKQLQHLYDNDKLPLADNVTWISNVDEAIGKFSWSDFMSSKYVSVKNADDINVIELKEYRRVISVYS